MKIEKLKQFLVQAKKNTYASGGENKADVFSGGRRKYTYKQDDFEYIDIYKGHEEFVGKEEVKQADQLVWQMEYRGKILSEKISADDIYKFLRKALKMVSGDSLFRGPENFTEGNYKYINNTKGDIEDFSGIEKIFYKDELVYELSYKGMMIKK